MFELILFVLFALVALAAAIGVVAQRNVLYSALLLVLNFLCLAALYVLMNAQFVAVAQIIVYAGAVMVLFLFTVMLLPGKRIEVASRRLAGQGPLAVLLVAVLGGVLLLLLGGSLAASGRPASATAGVGNVQALAQVLFTRYVWTFEATGVLLLVAVAGVVHLLRGGPRPGAPR
ncbi:MAG: NADH-quinone oxidoreductase subunit J [Anaerolineae bacterium]|nr:NADH-quinone oxidoreductase subunit J [Anaerolineae bacterium]